MNVSIEDLSAVEKKISVTIPADKVARELDRAYQNLQGQVMLRGFRRGKVPRKILKARYGAQIEGEVSSRLVSDSLDATIEANNIFMVSRPNVEMGDLTGGDFSFSAIVEIKPEVDATGYEGLALERDVYSLDEKIITNEIEQLRRQQGSMEPVEEDRGLVEGDVAVINYTLSIEGEVVEGPIDNFQVEIRSEAMLPGFAGEVAGLKKGESKSFELDAPETVPSPELAGKRLKFDVTLNEIKTLVLPALDDEFAKDLEVESLEALYEKHRAAQRAHLDENAHSKMKHTVGDKLIEANPIDLPKGLVNQHTDRLVRQRVDMLRRQGLGEQAAALVEADRDNVKAEAIRQISRALILESIAAKEGLEISDDDVNARFAAMAKETKQQVAAIKGYYMKNNLMGDLKESILQDKALDAVIAKAAITDVEKTYADHSHDHDGGADHDHDDHDHDHDHDHDGHDHDHDH